MTLDQFFQHWEQIHQDTLVTIAKFQDAELPFRPYPDSWTAGQVMLHIADAEQFWYQQVIMQAVDDGADYAPADYPNIAAIRALLAAVHQRSLTILAGLTLDDLPQTRPFREAAFSLNWIIWHVIEHEIHHRAELSLMLGMLGREGLDV